MLSRSCDTGNAIAVSVRGTVKRRILFTGTDGTVYRGSFARRLKYQTAAMPVERISLTVTARSVIATASARLSLNIYESATPNPTFISCSKISVAAVGNIFPRP